MAPESTWLIKVKTAISKTLTPTIKRSNVGVLAFEISSLMSKLLHLWQSLSDENIICLRNDSISLDGVHKIVSNDEAFLLSLACAEMANNLRLVAKSVSQISKRCTDLNLKRFDDFFNEFSNLGSDPYGWVSSMKEMEARNIKKMDQYVKSTSALYKEMDELSLMENGLRKLESESLSNRNEQKIIDLQQKILWQGQEVNYLKERSLWNKSFNFVTLILVRSVFTTLSRIKFVFGLKPDPSINLSLTCLSSSATVHPSDQNSSLKESNEDFLAINGFFESNSKFLRPPSTTLGASALALHYANLIKVIEKMIQSPQLVGADARDDLYEMLPESIRFLLRARLKGVGFVASDEMLANEWREALGRILRWLSPLAINMIKWQSERSFEKQGTVDKKTDNVMLFQTLYFANKEKTEAAITELLVGLNYIWRFEREITAKALFECN